MRDFNETKINELSAELSKGQPSRKLNRLTDEAARFFGQKHREAYLAAHPEYNLTDADKAKIMAAVKDVHWQAEERTC